MKMGSYILILAVLSFSFLSPLSPPVAAYMQMRPISYRMVNEFCNRECFSTKRASCVEVFKPDPRSQFAHDNLTLFKVAMERGISHVINTRSHFLRTIKAKPEFNSSLDFCVYKYDLVVTSFQLANRQVTNGDGNMMNEVYDLEIASNYASQCLKRLEDDGVRDESLLEKSRAVINYTTVCHEIADIVT